MTRTWMFLLVLALVAGTAAAQPQTPELTGAVNDSAGIIDAESRAELERRIDALMAATGDVVVVATVPDIEGFMSIEEFAVRLFENRGRGIGQKGKDNGVLIVVAMAERQVRVEVGYDLEQFVTDGFAGTVIRERIRPEFREQRYGAGILAGTTTIINRIAQGRGVDLANVPREAEPARRRTTGGAPFWPFLLMLILFMLMSRRRRRRRRYWGGPFGWSSGVGPFGGGFGTGFGGGFGGFGGRGGRGFGGGGFGGFGGGRSGGGGASGGW